MRVLVTGIPSYLHRTISGVSGTEVRHRPYFGEVGTRKALIDEVKKIGNTGNYLIGEAAAYCLRAHDVTYMPFWHLAGSRNSAEVLDEISEAFDVCVFVSPNILRRGFSADAAVEVFTRLKLPVVVMGIGVQRKGILDDGLPEATLKLLEILRSKDAYFLTRGYFTAEFLREQGMKFVKPVGCPSLFHAPDAMRRSLSALANPDLALAQEVIFSGYLGSVPDTIADAHALLESESTASYVLQDEIVAHDLSIGGEDGEQVYDAVTGRIVAPAQYKHLDKWQRDHELRIFFDTTQWRSWASTKKFSIGRRFHGSVIGMQAGIPALMIAVDDRMRELLEFIGFPYVEASVWNQEQDKKAYLANYLSKIDKQAIIDRYSACEANFRSALSHAGF